MKLSTYLWAFYIVVLGFVFFSELPKRLKKAKNLHAVSAFIEPTDQGNQMTSEGYFSLRAEQNEEINSDLLQTVEKAMTSKKVRFEELTETGTSAHGGFYELRFSGRLHDLLRQEKAFEQSWKAIHIQELRIKAPDKSRKEKQPGMILVVHLPKPKKL